MGIFSVNICSKLNMAKRNDGELFRRLFCLCFFLISACHSDIKGNSKADQISQRAQVLIIPGQSENYSPSDIQIRVEIEDEYLMSWFPWPVRSQVSQISFIVNLKTMAPGPAHADVSVLERSSDLSLVSLFVAPREMLDVRADPDHPTFSPSIYIGRKPIVKKSFGLDVRQNFWLGADFDVKNEQYSGVNGGRITVLIICRGEVGQSSDAESCLMEFPLEDPNLASGSYHFAPFVRVSLLKTHLHEWATIMSRIRLFLSARSRVEPLRDSRKEGAEQ